jgi:hypothetical protein
MMRPLASKEIPANSVAEALDHWNAHAADWGVDDADLISVTPMPGAAPYPIQFVEGEAPASQVVVVFIYRGR